MRLLLDTHILLWALSDPSRLAPETRRQIENPHHVVFVSAASVWEIAIKVAIRKLEAPRNLESVIRASHFTPLPISWSHAVAAGDLPALHKDPFDRMLMAQAKVEGLTFLTHDRRLRAYGPFVRASS